MILCLKKSSTERHKINLFSFLMGSGSSVLETISMLSAQYTICGDPTAHPNISRLACVFSSINALFIPRELIKVIQSSPSPSSNTSTSYVLTPKPQVKFVTIRTRFIRTWLLLSNRALLSLLSNWRLMHFLSSPFSVNLTFVLCRRKHVIDFLNRMKIEATN